MSKRDCSKLKKLSAKSRVEMNSDPGRRIVLPKKKSRSRE